jgi:hypothetical protein
MTKLIGKLIILSFLLFSFSCGENKNTPEYVTKQYLLAFQSKDWDKAVSYIAKEDKANFDMFRSLNNNAGITEVKDIRCEKKDSSSNCTFCCFNDSINSMFSNTVHLRKNKEGTWEVRIPKESGAPKGQE